MTANPDDDLAAHLVDVTLPTPLYHQIYLLLRERIVSGRLPPGALLPGEQDLARRLGVSRITVKRALNELAARGLVERQRGRGTSVAGGAVIPLVAGTFDTLLEGLQRMGLQTAVELLEVEEEAAEANVAERLEIKPGALVQRAVRLRRLSGQPFSHLVNYIPVAIARRRSRLHVHAHAARTGRRACPGGRAMDQCGRRRGRGGRPAGCVARSASAAGRQGDARTPSSSGAIYRGPLSSRPLPLPPAGAAQRPRRRGLDPPGVSEETPRHALEMV
jgi:DNA-binding transcriptional regulator YhcF (GntR family)